jgi:hypothetical protein
MTGDLVKTENFQGISVRVVHHDNTDHIPLVDIADALGIDRSGLRKLFRRHEATLGKYSSKDIMTSEAGTREFICLNQRGMMLLLLKIKPGASSNPDVEEKIVAFNEWAIEILHRAAKGENVLVSSIDTELQQAKRIAELTDTDPRIMWAAALRKCGLPEYADVLRPALVHGETGWYNPTRLVTLCNDPDLTPERLNWYLKNKGFQYRDGYIWRLTPMGLIHGREYNFEAPSGHVEIRIAWRESVLYASGLKRPIAEDQTALARAA